MNHSRDCAWVIAGIARWKQCEQWHKEGGVFVPKLASFLRQRNWLAPTLAVHQIGVDVAAIDAEIAKMNGHGHGNTAAGQGGSTFDGVATVVPDSRAIGHALHAERAVNANDAVTVEEHSQPLRRTATSAGERQSAAMYAPGRDLFDAPGPGGNSPFLDC